MKNMKLLLLAVLLGTVSMVQASTTATAAANGSTTIVNKSDMAIMVAYNYTANGNSSLAYWSSPIAPGATGTLAFKAGDIIGQVTIFYSKNLSFTDASKSDPAVDGQIRFVVNKIDGCSLYVYGKGAVLPGAIDTVTNSATPLASRYAAWWTGSIPAADLTSTSTVQSAISDPAVRALVTMHVANVQGLNDSTPASQIPAGVTVTPAF